MDSNVVQVWREGREKYRPAGEPINTREYEVARIQSDREVKEFVLAHHYSGSFPAARFKFGLYHHAKLVGVVVYSIPCNNVVLSVLPCPREHAVELGRLVLLDEVPSNAESWTVARAMDLIRKEGIEGVVSFSDPMHRTDDAGRLIFVGHAGVAYRALNANYHGRATSRPLLLLPNGTVFSARALSKIRSKEVGWEYAVRQLCMVGAEDPIDDSEAGLREWVKTWVPKVTRKVKHPGNLRYLFPLTKGVRKALPPSLPYLKYRKEPGKPLVILEG